MGHVATAVVSHLVQVPVFLDEEDVRPRAALFGNLADLRTDHFKGQQRYEVDGLLSRCPTEVSLR